MDIPHATPERSPQHQRQRQAELIARALAHIDARLDQPLTADVLADRAAMSRFHFHRVFFAHLGCSVGTYVGWRPPCASASPARGRRPAHPGGCPKVLAPHIPLKEPT